MAQNLSGPGRRYREPSELALPPAPAGFSLQFHVNADRYTFSLKDTLDPCRYAIFSDQDRDIYEAIPMRGGMVVPAGTERPLVDLPVRSRRANQSERPSGQR